MARTPTEILHLLHARGAGRLETVRLRSNRRTLWSLTAGGRTLNLHRAFADAPDELLVLFAVIARGRAAGEREMRAAARRVGEWPPVREAMGRLRRAAVEEDIRAAERGEALPACCGTDAQRRYLRRLYRWYNVSRFQDALPAVVPLRLSARMRRRLGHLKPGPDGASGGGRMVAEIALNVDLMLPANDGLREDTLLHEMAHAADYLSSGRLDHGRGWRRWAEEVGCRPRACSDRDLYRRRGPATVVTRVPPLPLGARLRIPETPGGIGGPPTPRPPQ